MVENFFEHRLCKLDVTSLSVMGFDCFRRYFCCLNAQNKSLRMDSPIDDFLVLEFDGLLGLDQLWNVALGSYGEVVFKESMALLVALYQKVNDTRQFNAVRKSFVDRCMERLQQAHQQITLRENVANAQNQIDRLIFMLKVPYLPFICPPLSTVRGSRAANASIRTSCRRARLGRRRRRRAAAPPPLRCRDPRPRPKRCWASSRPRPRPSRR
jgi:hypothetical protein